MTNFRLYHLLTILLISVVCISIRAPQINADLPYMYDEDEAHHFNRQAEMLKTKDLNPRYFLKPSLNFYLRLPTLAAGFFYDVKKERIRNVGEIVTKDKYGLAGYNFIPSHPTLLKADRLFSIVISTGIIILVYLCCIILGSSNFAATFAALLLSISPLSIQHSASVGVNQPTAFFCMLSIFGTLYAIKNKRFLGILITSIASGLAISTKYNALPIVLVPLVTFLLVRPFSIRNFLVVLIAPWLTFVAASPYMLIEIPTFLNHVAYEIWHYSVSGHVNNQANPGLEQLMFYLRTTASEGIGLIAAILAAFGLVAAIISKKRSLFFPIIVFVLAYLGLMSAQKANFSRNLLLVLPAITIFSAVAIDYFWQRKFKLIAILIAITSLATLVTSSNLCDFNKSAKEDSRQVAYRDILSLVDQEVFIDGNLELPKFTEYRSGENHLIKTGVTRGDARKETISTLLQKGYKQILLPTYYKINDADQKLLKTSKNYLGNNEEQRVINNPAMKLYVDISTPLQLVKRFESNLKTYTFCEQNTEFWIEQKVSIIDLSACAAKVKLKINAPWPNQKITILNENKELKTIKLDQGLNEVEFNKFVGKKLFLYVDRLSSPLSQNLSSDNRRLGTQVTF